MKSIDPTTGKVVKEFKDVSFDQAVEKLKQTKSNFPAWKALSVSQRLKYFKKVLIILEKDEKKYAQIISKEVGRPIKDAIDEVRKCASLCKYYLENAEKLLQDEVIQTEAHKSYVTFEPLGLILGIMPWNYPFWQALRTVIPVMISGNVYALKHASNMPQCSLAIEEIMNKAGLKNQFVNLMIPGAVASKLIETDYVSAVSITGSSEAGKKVAEIAGRNLKKVVLELGGSDAFIILKDADVDRAIKEFIGSRFLNSGQSCNAAKRIIAVKSVAKKVEQKLVEAVSKLKVGNPSEDVNMGPLNNIDSLNLVNEQIKDAVKKGAKVLLGGKAMNRGYFFEPTVITNVKKWMRVANEETFCPVAVVIEVKDEKEAIEEANRSIYGLGCSIWTKNIANAEKLSKLIETGIVCINKKVRSDPRMPFGGIKQSGYGRELGEYGLTEFCNVKSVVIEK